MLPTVIQTFWSKMLKLHEESKKAAVYYKGHPIYEIKRSFDRLIKQWNSKRVLYRMVIYHSVKLIEGFFTASIDWLTYRYLFSSKYYLRPVGRGVAGMARATPTFGRSKPKSTVGHPNFWRTEAINGPPQL